MIKRLAVGMIVLAVFIFSALPAHAETELEQLRQEFKAMQENMAAMQKKIDQLEGSQAQVQAEQVEIKESVEKGVSAGDKLSWKGYFSWHFEDLTQDGKNPTFDSFIFSLIPKVTLNEKADIYAHLIWEHAPFYDISVNSVSGAKTLDARDSGEFSVNDIYGTYTVSEKLKIRAGKFAVPFGIWNTLQYAAPVYTTLKQPGRDTFYSRGSTTATDANLFARYTMGAWFLGSYDDLFSYDLYVGNGRTLLAQHSDDNRNKAFGARLSKDLSLGASNFKLSYSYFQDKLRTSSTTAFFRQQTNALGAEWSLNDFKLFSEFANSRRGGTPINAFYTMAQYSLTDRIIPYVQYQLYEPNRHIGKDKTEIYSWGLAYHLLPYQVILKAQVERIQEENPTSQDYNRYNVGVAAAF